MQELFKIVVFVLQRLLQERKPLFGSLNKIEISAQDGIRKCYLSWSPEKGVKFDE